MGIDIPQTILKLGSRVHFVHFREVRGSGPQDFKETFQDNGQTDMLMAIRAWFEVGFKGTLL
jgi:mannonate dehydratase